MTHLNHLSAEVKIMQRFIPASRAALLVLATGGAACSQVPLDPKPYVLVEQGDLPVVLSAPHGGEVAPPGVPERAQGTFDLDVNTLALARSIQAELGARTGGRKAHLVAARVSRHFVDLNRPASQAYDSDALVPVYQAYHASLANAVTAAKALAGPRALLIDIHGQSDDVSRVYRGTRDGQTGDLALLCRTDPPGLFPALGLQGVKVQPETADTREPRDYNGGFIVSVQGLGGSGGINAIQLEFGFDLRRDAEAIAGTARAVAAAIVAHLDTSAPQP